MNQGVFNPHKNSKHVGKFSRTADVFGCKDIFFSIINENINALEPIVFGFQEESSTLLRLAREM